MIGCFITSLNENVINNSTELYSLQNSSTSQVHEHLNATNGCLIRI